MNAAAFPDDEVDRLNRWIARETGVFKVIQPENYPVGRLCSESRICWWPTFVLFDGDGRWFHRNLELSESRIFKGNPSTAVVEQATAKNAALRRNAQVKIAKLDLRDRDLRFADLSGARMPQMDLRKAKLTGASMNSAFLQGANLTNARLIGASVAYAQLQGAKLIAARMTGVDLSGAKLQGSDLRGAQFQGADFRQSQLQGANLVGAGLQGANLRGANLGGADLRGTQFQGAILGDAVLQGADLRAANLTGANLDSAQMQGANMVGASLRGTDMSRAELHGAATDQRTNFSTAFIRNVVHGPLTPEVAKGIAQKMLHTLSEARGADETVVSTNPGIVLKNPPDYLWRQVEMYRKIAKLAAKQNPLSDTIRLADNNKRAKASAWCDSGGRTLLPTVCDPVRKTDRAGMDAFLLAVVAKWLQPLACTSNAKYLTRAMARRAISGNDVSDNYRGYLALALLGNKARACRDAKRFLSNETRAALRKIANEHGPKK